MTLKRRQLQGTLLTHPGVYCLRTNVPDWDEKTLWRTYSTLTDVEAVFRSLKSELGLRPIFHQTPKRADGDMVVTVIAYQLVQAIRRRLGEHGERQSSAGLRRILEGQQRVTATFRRKDGRSLHVRPLAPSPIRAPSIRHWLSTRPRRHQENGRLTPQGRHNRRNVVPHAANMPCNLLKNNRFSKRLLNLG